MPQPDQTVLHRVVREHLNTFLAQGMELSEDGALLLEIQIFYKATSLHAEFIDQLLDKLLQRCNIDGDRISRRNRLGVQDGWILGGSATRRSRSRTSGGAPERGRPTQGRCPPPQTVRIRHLRQEAPR
jgi:hypothetical protein